jgi:hypothetical protein
MAGAAPPGPGRVCVMPNETPIEPSTQSRPGPSRLLYFAVAGAAVLVAALIFLWPGPGQGPAPAVRRTRLPFGTAEQAYAPKIRIESLEMSRAENFLHQEVTTLSGSLENTGERALGNVELTVEFSDELPQVILRESRAVFPATAGPLPPGQRRKFEISFEHIPADWNMQQPAVRVSGITFYSKE